MVFVRQRTQLKNRIHATLAQYALHDVDVTDLFGVRGRIVLRQRLDRLPPHTGYATAQLLKQIESLDQVVGELEGRIQAAFKPTPVIQRLLTVPGVGLTLAVVIALEVGNPRDLAVSIAAGQWRELHSPRWPARCGRTQRSDISSRAPLWRERSPLPC
jgi:transposase